METKNRDYILPNRAYDILKQVVQLLLPAVATLYFTLSQIWGLPNGEEVVGTITAIAVFIGVFLKIADNSYNSSEAKYDGVIDVTEDEESGLKRADLFLKNYENPADVVMQDEVLFKINPHD